jgi:hypothetical protein
VEEVIVAKDFGSLLPGLIAVERLNNQFLHALVPRKILIATQWGCNGGVDLLVDLWVDLLVDLWVDLSFWIEQGI